MNQRPQDRGTSITGPFILIGVGVVLLLNQLDVLHWSLWEVAFRLWPLIIIAVGADVLIARRSFLAAAASLVLMLGLLAGGLYLMGSGTLSAGERVSENIAIPLEDAKQGRIDISLDAGQLEIGSLEESSADIVAGILHDEADYGRSSVSNQNGKLTVTLSREWPNRSIFYDDKDFFWELDFTRRIPLDVDLSLGAGQIVADLSGIQLSSVDVQIGAGQLILTLPADRNIDVSVKIGAGDAQIRLPEGAMVDIDCTTAVGNCSLPGASGLWSQSYTSSGYGKAEYKIDISINVAVGEGRVYFD
jgi:hypothetical protein